MELLALTRVSLIQLNRDALFLGSYEKPNHPWSPFGKGGKRKLYQQCRFREYHIRKMSIPKKHLAFYIAECSASQDNSGAAFLLT
jgi:hypothetical protein